MKYATIFLGLAATASANIKFVHAPLACNITSPKMYHGCFRGQTCQDGIGCVPDDVITYPSSFGPRRIASVARAADGPISLDGFCGPAHGNTICDAKSTNYPGGCCSQYGYCGNTIDHCGTGCISGCTATLGGAATVTSTATAPRADGLCGKQNGGAACDASGPYGGCCSQYGYCGSTTNHCAVINGCQNGCDQSNKEPVIGPVAGGSGDGTATTDGTCGASNGNTICGSWPSGNCCSAYGFCGKTDGHCGAGCQSGNCLSAPSLPAHGPSPAPVASVQGTFTVVGQAGVAPMHAALMPNGRVTFLDKLEDYSQIKNPDGTFAMASEYDPSTGQVVPLYYDSNAFCSGGTFLADGRLISVGGNAPLSWVNPNIKDGFRAVRYLKRSSTDSSLDGQSWSETNLGLASARWYATTQTMPDGTIFVASGSLNGLDPSVASNNNPTYEILDRNGASNGKNIPMEILEKNQPYYMYPFVHLLKDGNLFVFTAKSSQIFNVQSNKVVQELPGLPGDYRTYPNTGGSVLLPLSSKNNWEPEVIICGGGAYQDITSPTDASCGRISPLVSGSKWQMESMPEGRGMVEATLLPDGTVLWLNGGNRGAQGFELMANPTLDALLYDPAKPLGQRWTTVGRSEIPRLYHSVAMLMPDATVMVAGSNPVEMPKLQPDAKDPYVTEFRVEQFVPPYFKGSQTSQPSNLKIASPTIRADGSTFTLSFNTGRNNAQAGDIKIMLYHGGFVTHSIHMGHRMIQLDIASGFVAGEDAQSIVVTGPPTNNVAPPGPYWVYIVVGGVPAKGVAVQVV